ncbi:LCP family protein [Geodermatophilus nigrescens]
MLVTVAGLAIAYGTEQVDGVAEGVARVGDASPAEKARPPETAPEAVTVLVVGIDPSDEATGATRAEATLVVRLTGDRQHVQVVTLPPDTWVEDAGRTLEDAFGAEGPAGVVSAVEALSGVRIGHYTELDFGGLADVVDALGGITVDVPEVYENRGYSFAVGLQPMDGEAAVAYVRDVDATTRAGAPARYQRVQALFTRVRDSGALTDLGRLSSLTSSVTAALRVDESLADEDLVATAWEFRAVSQPEFVAAPAAGTADRSGQQVTELDPERAASLWEHLQADDLAAHVGDVG